MKNRSLNTSIIVGALLVIIIMAAGTFAWFTTTATIPTDFTAGRIELTKNLPDGPLTWVNMLPGVWETQKRFEISNTGINPPVTLKYQLVATKTGENMWLFGDKIIVEVKKQPAGTVLYNGPLKDIGVIVASIAPGVTDQYSISCKLHDLTGNAYQMPSHVSFDFKAYGTQLINPGWTEN